jgi:hypothetical protein
MTAEKQTLRARLTALRANPRVAAFSLVGPAGQVFDLVDQVIAEIDALTARVDELEQRLAGLSAMHLQVAHLDGYKGRVQELERQLRGLGALRVNPIGGGR